jgi:hypothetical protein
MAEAEAEISQGLERVRAPAPALAPIVTIETTYGAADSARWWAIWALAAAVLSAMVGIATMGMVAYIVAKEKKLEKALAAQRSGLITNRLPLPGIRSTCPS